MQREQYSFKNRLKNNAAGTILIQKQVFLNAYATIPHIH